ncbi:hypothetical protein LEP1GSC150_0190, partial [Leptospira interrogans serovar Copenhageni str. LT2050]
MTSEKFFFNLDEEIVMSKEEKLKRLGLMQSEVSACKLCKLETTRTQTVFGEGNPDAE